MSTETHHKNQSPLATAFILLPQGGKRFAQIKDLLTIGRDSSNQLSLNDRFASSRHARIERREGVGFILRDLRSRNGTYVNGAKVVEAQLAEGDRLLVGETELIFSDKPELTTQGLSLQSRNAQWQRQLRQLPHWAASDLPVLLQGPSGAGKDVVAQALHQLSPRAQAPWISVNCSSLTETLAESELFGHVRGSFTGALQDRAGAFQAAKGGTLFLDEIGDLPLSLQPKLLRALENSEVRPVGSDKVVKTKVKVISASHRNLRQMVRTGQFREDLYFRLNVLKIVVPALKDRIEDLESLFYHFAKQHRVRFTHAAIEKLKEHKWPGNIRELRNVVARAKAYYPNSSVEADQVAALFEAPINDPCEVAKPEENRLPVIKEIELQMILDRLLAHDGNQRRAAQDLGMPKSTLHDRIKAYGIDVRRLLNERDFKV